MPRITQEQIATAVAIEETVAAARKEAERQVEAARQAHHEASERKKALDDALLGADKSTDPADFARLNDALAAVYAAAKGAP